MAAYKRLARKASKVWMEHGALAYFETAGDDLNHKGLWSFQKALKARRNETIVLAWIVYKSKTHRNAVNKKVMADPRIANFDASDMPFDPKKLLYGGFKTFVEG